MRKNEPRKMCLSKESLRTLVVGGQPRQSESCVHSDCCLPYTPACVATLECQVTDECAPTWNQC